MRNILFLFLPMLLVAQVHYAKLEPFETYIIKSAVSGQVVKADESQEGKLGSENLIVQIDDKVDKAQYKALQRTLTVLKESLELTKEMLKNSEAVFKRDFDYYNRIKDLKTKSKTEKDRIYTTMIASKNQVLNFKQNIANLNKQITDTEYQLVRLKDIIEKKAIKAKNLYIYKVEVKKGDYVNPGSILLKAMDLSKGRLTLYIDSDEAKDLSKRKVYINNKQTDYKVNKLIRVADETHISAYRAEIIIDNPDNLFSKLLKVEIK
ncbi:hypothetical protein [Hydrogenimonas thermophila]|uniref:HlyD family secretion protein n=1 Tax=Hydrogenimonas thermophila TaxID=223786 RepID=A0A1I5QFR7_9BACT|nr:hypothetical protein [Hydrogenimonas thermophila]WOE68868.1 hypothetical protein RZR91_07065 [Hydrogenimonas thermophila]WOE71376.1 hypothetical protein RZR97_07035 [Hydrogenimonas thermophila]SFP45082.1 hypothetical protein SAMN05216234_1204 [Hydrogenimonas thermophila]